MYGCRLGGCDDTFYSQHTLHQVRQARSCVQRRGSGSLFPLEQHETLAKKHQPLTAFCRNCDKGFTSQANLFKHQENSSRCHSVVQDLHERLIEYDRSGFLTNRAIEPAPYSDRSRRMRYSSTSRAWNGRLQRWVCFCDRDFGSKGALDQHLASPYHDAKTLACPAPECRRPFQTLSSLIGHIESRSCRFGAFEILQEELASGRLQELFSSRRTITAY